MGSVDTMLVKEAEMQALSAGYKLPMDKIGDAALRFSIADANVCWRTIFQHASGVTEQPSTRLRVSHSLLSIIVMQVLHWQLKKLHHSSTQDQQKAAKSDLAHWQPVNDLSIAQNTALQVSWQGSLMSAPQLEDQHAPAIIAFKQVLKSALASLGA